MRLKLILSYILIIYFSGHALARDVIIYEQRSSSRIIAASLDGSNNRVIQSDAIDFTVSPDASKMIVFHNGCLDKDSCKLTLYDLKKATVKTIVASHADWYSGKWISNEEFYVTRQVRSDGIRRACGDGDELKGCAVRAILQTATFDFNSCRFTIVKNLGVGDYEALNKEFPLEQEENIPSLSYNQRYSLMWLGSEHWTKTLVVRDKDINRDSALFQRKPRDFAEYYHYYKMPWSPDSRLFVLEYYPGGFLYTIFSGEKKIMVVDRTSLKKRIIGKGSKPYWLQNFPDTFIEQP
jgi:hypothetical protein